MPTSIDPLPGENEIECAHCGAIIYDGLSRCPECGVNLYEPEDDFEEEYFGRSPAKRGILTKVGEFFRRLVGKPYSAEEVFGDALDQAALYHDLLGKVGGDHKVAERLIDFERREQPNGNRLVWLQNAIHRWERDNRVDQGVNP